MDDMIREFYFTRTNDICTNVEFAKAITIYTGEYVDPLNLEELHHYMLGECRGITCVAGTQQLVMNGYIDEAICNYHIFENCSIGVATNVVINMLYRTPCLNITSKKILYMSKDNLSRIQMILLLKSYNPLTLKISHTNFSNDEWIEMRHDHNVYTEDGCLFDDWVSKGQCAHDGIRSRIEGDWENGWFVKEYTPISVKSFATPAKI